MSDILDIDKKVYQVHLEVKERIEILKNLIPIIADPNVWIKIESILNYFNKTVVEHFEGEEIIISVMKRDTSFSDEENKIMSEILEEHKELLGVLEQIKATAKVYEYSNYPVKEKFIEITHMFIESIVAHAEKEDMFLFPIFKAKMSKEQFEEIMKNILSKVKMDKERK